MAAATTVQNMNPVEKLLYAMDVKVEANDPKSVKDGINHATNQLINLINTTNKEKIESGEIKKIPENGYSKELVPTLRNEIKNLTNTTEFESIKLLASNRFSIGAAKELLAQRDGVPQPLKDDPTLLIEITSEKFGDLLISQINEKMATTKKLSKEYNKASLATTPKAENQKPAAKETVETPKSVNSTKAEALKTTTETPKDATKEEKIQGATIQVELALRELGAHINDQGAIAAKMSGFIPLKSKPNTDFTDQSRESLFSAISLIKYKANMENTDGEYNPAKRNEIMQAILKEESLTEAFGGAEKAEKQAKGLFDQLDILHKEGALYSVEKNRAFAQSMNIGASMGILEMLIGFLLQIVPEQWREKVAGFFEKTTGKSAAELASTTDLNSANTFNKISGALTKQGQKIIGQVKKSVEEIDILPNDMKKMATDSLSQVGTALKDAEKSSDFGGTMVKHIKSITSGESLNLGEKSNLKETHKDAAAAPKKSIKEAFKTSCEHTDLKTKLCRENAQHITGTGQDNKEAPVPATPKPTEQELVVN